MHLRYETTYALGLLRNAVGSTRRNCAGGTDVQRSKCCPSSSTPDLSLDGRVGRNYEGCGDPATSSWQSVWVCTDAPHVVMLIATGARVSLCSSAQSAWRLSDVATAATDLNYLGRSVRGMRSACGWAQLAFPAEPSSMCARQESSCVARSAPDDRGSVLWFCGHATLPVCMHPFAGLQTTGTCKQTARC